MKILIAADMEGISGVVNWDQVNSTHAEYPRFRKIMTHEVNAAIRGVFDGGTDEVIVADGHGSATNILIEEVDPRARLNTGSPSPFSMVQGIGVDINGVIFIGYHARAGSQNAILDHTWSSSRVANVWLNDILTGEYGLNAAVCGHFGVPVLMLTGDQTACAQASELLGSIETVIVKQASGRMAAECLPPKISQEKIYQTALRAVTRLKEDRAPQPFRPAQPIKIIIELFDADMTDRAVLLPGTQRLDGRRIQISAEDMPTAYAAFRAAVTLAR